MPELHSAPAYRLGGRRAWLMWGIGVLAYVIAVFHRYSLGVTGIEAADRFGVSAAVLSVFSVVQLGVYAAMQVPAGVLLDRLGSKRLIAAGALLMGLGQLLFALSGGLGPAMVARVLLGVGDALTFVSVLRLVVLWFPPRQNPVVVQLTGLIGQLGAVASAVPLIAVLGGFGWETTFAAAAGLSAVVAVVVLLGLRDSPYAAIARPPFELATMRRSVRETFAEPGTRLGFWTHFVTQFPAVAFSFAVGVPVPGDRAGALAGDRRGTVDVAGGRRDGLRPAARLPGRALSLPPLLAGAGDRRSLRGDVGVWAVVLGWPGRVPLPVLVLLILAMAPNTPGSMIAFDYARTFNPPERVGSASGIVNVGGFTASLVVIVLVGLVVDLLSAPGEDYSTTAFRWAFAVQFRCGCWGRCRSCAGGTGPGR